MSNLEQDFSRKPFLLWQHSEGLKTKPHLGEAVETVEIAQQMQIEPNNTNWV